MDLMTLAEVSEYVRVPESTLRYYRHIGEGPKTFRIGGKVVSKREDVDAWLEAAYADAVGGPAA